MIHQPKNISNLSTPLINRSKPILGRQMRKQMATHAAICFQVSLNLSCFIFGVPELGTRLQRLLVNRKLHKNSKMRDLDKSLGMTNPRRSNKTIQIHQLSMILPLRYSTFHPRHRFGLPIFIHVFVKCFNTSGSKMSPMFSST